MPCVVLENLPPPPAGKVGWPWTESCPTLPAQRPDGTAWPRISIVTPSYNQGEYIEETIRSILLQGYPELEYFIIDGGSTDESLQVIQKYATWLSGYRSGPDKGQADAVNMGLAQATGEVFHFINSDDILAPGALASVGSLADRDVTIAGPVLEFAGETTHLVRNTNLSAYRMLHSFERTAYCTWHQPGVWMNRRNLVELGGFDINFWFCFDFHLTVRYFERWPEVRYTDHALVRFRLHPEAKTSSGADRVLKEHLATLDDLADKLTTEALRRQARMGKLRTLWPSRVMAIRAGPGSSFAKALRLAVHVCLQPHVSADRFTFGAIRRELQQALRFTSTHPRA